MRGIFSWLALSAFGYIGFAVVTNSVELPSFASTLSSIREQQTKEVPSSRRGYQPNQADKDWDDYYRSRLNQVTVSKTSVEEVFAEIKELVDPKRDWTRATKCWGSHEECAWLLALEFVENANNVPPLLLISMARLESNLTAYQKDGTPIKSPPDKNGRIDWGIIQVRNWQQKGCRMDTVADQIQCGSKFIRKLIDQNGGDVFKGLSAYASGNPRSENAFVKNFSVAIRVILWQALENGARRGMLHDIINVYGRQIVRKTKNLSDWGKYLQYYRSAPLEV